MPHRGYPKWIKRKELKDRKETTDLKLGDITKSISTTAVKTASTVTTPPTPTSPTSASASTDDIKLNYDGTTIVPINDPTSAFQMVSEAAKICHISSGATWLSYQNLCMHLIDHETKIPFDDPYVQIKMGKKYMMYVFLKSQHVISTMGCGNSYYKTYQELVDAIYLSASYYNPMVP